jgi:hypothetical protein
MVKLQRRPIGEPDDVREVPNGRLETYDLGEIRIGRSILQPGWRWSESIKPIARTELCEYHHIGFCVAGSSRVRMREGAELDVGAGEVCASWATRELLAGSPIRFTDRGLHALKGLAEERRVYQVEPVGPGATTADT